jgi:tetratricopeptide (TPR) repeat protein
MVRRARVDLALAEGRLKMLAGVIALCDSVLQRSTNSAEALAVRGQANFRIFQVAWPPTASTLQQAENDLGRAVSARPDHADAWIAFGDALYADSRFADALNAYNAAVKADPLLRTRLLVDGSAFFASVMTNKLDDAERWCRNMRSSFPTERQSQMCEITLLGNRGARAVDVAASWAEVRRLDRDPLLGPSTWSQRRMMVAAVLARAGKPDSARAVIRHTAEQLNGRRRADAAEAYVHTLLGDHDSAVRVLSQLLADFPRMRIGLARNPWYQGLASDPRFRALALE